MHKADKDALLKAHDEYNAKVTWKAYGQHLFEAALAHARSGQAVAYLDLDKVSHGMAYASSFRVNDKQAALFKHSQSDKQDAERYRALRDSPNILVSVSMEYDGNEGSTPFITGAELDGCADSIIVRLKGGL